MRSTKDKQQTFPVIFRRPSFKLHNSLLLFSPGPPVRHPSSSPPAEPLPAEITHGKSKFRYSQTMRLSSLPVLVLVLPCCPVSSLLPTCSSLGPAMLPSPSLLPTCSSLGPAMLPSPSLLPPLQHPVSSSPFFSLTVV